MHRRAILLAGAAALLPLAAVQASADRLTESPAPRFSPTSAPLILTRTLYRSLADGKQVVVTRRFAIHITPVGNGFQVDGEQIDAAVDAPPALRGLADLERKRVETGLFPVRLDERGMVREGSPAPDPTARTAAARSARALIQKAPTAAHDGERRAALGQVVAAYRDSPWPTFLFNPGSALRRETRKVALPDGSEGEVEVRVEVHGLMDCGLPQALERVITTRLGGTSRESREVWSIAPAAPA